MSVHLQLPSWIPTSAPSTLYTSWTRMGNTESVVPVIVQETGMVAIQEEYHSGLVVRSVGIALGVMVLMVLSGIACKHYGVFRCLTQANQQDYNGNTRRDSYFARYVSRGRVRTDIENQAANALVLQPPPPPPVFISPMVAPPGYTTTKTPPGYTPTKTPAGLSTDQHIRMSGAEQFARLSS